MNWWQDVERGAAHEFGRRHYRFVAGWKLTRKVGPALLIVAAGALAAWGLFVVVRALLPVLIVLAILGGLVAGGALLYRLTAPLGMVSRWAVVAVPGTVVMVIGLAGSLLLWLY